MALNSYIDDNGFLVIQPTNLYKGDISVTYIISEVRLEMQDLILCLYRVQHTNKILSELLKERLKEVKRILKAYGSN